MPEQIEQPGNKNVKLEQDIAKYLEFTDPKKISQKELAEFRSSLEKWDQEGKVEQIRTAGVSQKENRDNFNKRHILLSQEFLSKDKTKEGVEFNIDFKNNQLAEWRVGLGDLLPPNVTEIKLKRADGTSAIGVRAQNPATGRFGYYEKEALNSKQYEYLACHTGDTCEITNTYTVPDTGLGDPRTYREHIEIYTNNAAREDHSDSIELDHYDPGTREVLTPAQTRERKATAVAKKSTEERAKIRTEVSSNKKPETFKSKSSNRPTGKFRPLPRSEVAATYTKRRVDVDIMTRDNRHNLEIMQVNPSKLKAIKKYLDHFDRHRSRYEYVAQQTGIPAIAILCIHRMEASLNFNTYLHNGQKLGKPTTYVPKGVFFQQGAGQWEKAAIHALGGNVRDDNGKPASKYIQKRRKDCSLDANSKDIAAMLTLLEPYNGLGYRNKRRVSPYIYGGTNIYERGLYVKDGVYDPNAVYKGVGAAAIMEVYFNRDKYGV